jgi:hypothetical protein
MRSLYESLKIWIAGKSVAQVGETDQSCRSRDPVQYIGCKIGIPDCFQACISFSAFSACLAAEQASFFFSAFTAFLAGTEQAHR